MARVPSWALGVLVGALVFCVIEGLRVFVLLKLGRDDPQLSAAANGLLAMLLTAIAAERVARHMGGGGFDK